MHNRPIVRACDDSVVRLTRGRAGILRRARGYAPLGIRIAQRLPAVLAVGGHLKNTVAIGVGQDVSFHVSTQAGAVRQSERHLFTDPPGAVAALKELEAQGLTHVILRAQWYGLPQEQVLATLELFKNDVLPAFS